MFEGRLGLETARVPYIDRHGLVWLERGYLYVESGTLRFVTAGTKWMLAGDYSLPFQNVSFILLGPGGSITHDALRLLARHGTGLICVGEDGVKFYASMPFGPNQSELSRRQVTYWADAGGRRITVARRMYAWRMGEVFPHEDITVLRGMEGTRMKETYRFIAQKYGVKWYGRRYDRNKPESADIPNQAINHAATFTEAAAMIAVNTTGTIPQLGFIHEDASIAFVLDIADLFRDKVTLQVAFSSAKEFLTRNKANLTIEQITRRHAGATLRQEKVIPQMIDAIKEVLKKDDDSSDT